MASGRCYEHRPAQSGFGADFDAVGGDNSFHFTRNFLASTPTRYAGISREGLNRLRFKITSPLLASQQPAVPSGTVEPPKAARPPQSCHQIWTLFNLIKTMLPYF